MAEGDKATVGVKLNFERPPSNEPSNKDSRSPLRTLDNAAPATEPKSASGANRRVSDGPSEGVAASTRDPTAAPTAEGSPVSASVGDAHFMTPAHALRARDEDATPEDTPATVRRLARSFRCTRCHDFQNSHPKPPAGRGAPSRIPRGDRPKPRDPNATLITPRPSPRPAGARPQRRPRAPARRRSRRGSRGALKPGHALIRREGGVVGSPEDAGFRPVRGQVEPVRGQTRPNPDGARGDGRRSREGGGVRVGTPRG